MARADILVSEVSEGEICLDPIDAIIVSSGFEERALFVAEKLDNIVRGQRLGLAFEDRRTELYRPVNDKKFTKLGYELILASGSDGLAAVNVLKRAESEAQGHPCRVVVDYSCMTRVWYASMLRYLWSGEARNIVVDFVYSPSEFSKPQPAKPNRYVEAVAGFSGLSAPLKPTALVVGLGYEAERAIGLVNYIEPAHTVAFLADPAFDQKFVQAAEDANEPLLSHLPKWQVVRYPLSNMRMTAGLMSSCCRGLIRDYRVIVAPLGPKPFALLSFILSRETQGLEVWRVSAGEKGRAKSRKPIGRLLCARVSVGEARRNL